MRNIKITIEYDGTALSGWQFQPHKRTVQGEIEKALRIIFKKNIRIHGAGRTDAGVHALGQVANFSIDSKMKTDNIVRALNGNIPDDIIILSAEEINQKFHSRYCAKRKTYQYSIFNRQTRPALNKDFVHHCPLKINLSIMRSEAKNLVGRHDFRSFTATDSAKKNLLTVQDTRRTIYDLTITKKAELIKITITANGFLYKMVRNIIGTLLEIGTGSMPQGSIKKILKAQSRTAAGTTAPAKGLTLLSVTY